MILIVDDDSSVVASLSLALKQAGYGFRSAAGPEEALRRLEEGTFQLVLQDMNFSRKTTGEEGLVLLRQIRSRYPELPVILITAWGSIPLAVEGMKAGASDFITKPWSNANLIRSVGTTLGLAALRAPRSDQETLTREWLDETYDFKPIIGRDQRLLRVLDLSGRVSKTDASVFITGESGTGKELIAEAIHRNSLRRHQPFVKVNLGGISSTLFESEMFGHVKGAFTDAYHERQGRFQLADRGTIFLDEIGDLDPGSQVKLLRVLQDRTYEVLGSSATRTVDVRVISATNRPIQNLVASGDFREDLLYRLNLISIHVPALRERPEDIPLLVRHFLHQSGQTYGVYRRTISDAAMAWLKKQPWPGNIREIKQAVERAVLTSRQAMLEIDDFEPLRSVDAPVGEPRTLPPAGEITLEEMERVMIEKAMAQFDGNISRVAEALGISRAALYRRFQKYGIQP